MGERILTGVELEIGLNLTQLLNGTAKLDEVLADFLVRRHDEEFCTEEFIGARAVHDRRREEETGVERLGEDALVGLQVVDAARHDDQFGRIAQAGIEYEGKAVHELERAVELNPRQGARHQHQIELEQKIRRQYIGPGQVGNDDFHGIDAFAQSFFGF